MKKFLCTVGFVLVFSSCTVQVETVRDEDIEAVTAACEMLFDEKVGEFQEWFDAYVAGKVTEAMVGIGCVPDNEIDIGWDCSAVCEL